MREQHSPRRVVNGPVGNSPRIAPAFVAFASSHAQIEIAAPPTRVWQVLSNIERWPSWNALVQNATLSGPLQPGSVFRWKSKGLSVMSTLIEVTPNRCLVWTGKALGTRALHTWEIDEIDRGTLLKTAEWFGGWLPRFMPTAMQRTLDETLPAWLQQIRAAAERSTTQAPSIMGADMNPRALTRQ